MTLPCDIADKATSDVGNLLSMSCELQEKR